DASHEHTESLTDLSPTPTARWRLGFKNSRRPNKSPPASAAAADPDSLRHQLVARPLAPDSGAMDWPKGTAVAGLYDDLMVEILSRVPVKDIRRSKCVSKPWRDLIDDPLHRKKLPQTLECFFHGGCGGSCGSYGQVTSLAGTGESMPPPVDLSFSFLIAKLPGVKHLVLLDSCNGLLLFGCAREDMSLCATLPPRNVCPCPPAPALLHLHHHLERAMTCTMGKGMHTPF
ncbi:unnamed protein product, partial [Urochloa humidicola]